MTAARTMRVTISGIYSEYEVPYNPDRWNGWAIPASPSIRSANWEQRPMR
jgi:hypothetical protein